MNTPDSSKMKQDCPEQNECIKLLQSILDGEATAEQKKDFMEKHLEECMPCYKNYHLEVAIRKLLKTKCSKEAPQGLVDEIKTKVIQNLSQ